jgi:hypothetical protein
MERQGSNLNEKMKGNTSISMNRNIKVVIIIMLPGRRPASLTSPHRSAGHAWHDVEHA